MDVAARISRAVSELTIEVERACVRVGRDPTTVRVIAVTKNQEPAVLAPLVAAGIRHIGENRLEHHSLMHAAIAAQGLDLEIHAIGRVQGRQLAKLAPLSTCLHSLCEADHVRRLANACAQHDLRFPVYLQVNTSGEAAKAGMQPAQLSAMIADVRQTGVLDPIGLMTIAEEGAPEVQIRSTFRRLRELAADHGLARLSMGMSQDFTIAIEEGATDIRIGTRLFT